MAPKRKKRKIFLILSAIIILAVTVSYFSYGKKEKVTYTVAKVGKGRIVQTVSETGTVKADAEIDLSFLNSGKLKTKYVHPGDNVEEGQTIAELDTAELEIKKEEAEASLELAQEDYRKLLSGATKEEIAVSEASENQAKSAYESALNELAKTKALTEENIAQAQKTYDDLILETESDITTYEQAVVIAENNLENTKKTYQKDIDNYKDKAITAMDDKITVANTALDTIDRTLDDDDGEDYIGIQNPQTLTNTTASYDSAVSYLTTAENDFNQAELYATNELINVAIESVLSALNKVFKALENCYTALENSVTTTTFSQSELDTLKSNISAQQTLVATAISGVQTAEQNLDDAILDYDTNVLEYQDALLKAQVALSDAKISAKNALSTAKIQGEQQIINAESKVSSTNEAWKVAKAQLDKLLAPANQYDVSLAQAKVKQARAAVDSIRKQLENSVIKAPIKGIITKDNFEVGEQVAIGAAALSMLGENNFEIEVLISEADIAKVSVGDKAEITLDSFGDDVKFTGHIYFIDPAETEIQDVIYYKLKIEFETEELGIKSGMTANVTITTEEKENVLIVPSRAIIDKNGQGRIVRVMFSGNRIEEREVVLGIRGDDGVTEVLTGLSEGEEVVTYIKTEK